VAPAAAAASGEHGMSAAALLDDSVATSATKPSQLVIAINPWI